jgi:hypothetical protein
MWRAFYRDAHGIVSVPAEPERSEVDPDDVGGCDVDPSAEKMEEFFG